MQPFPRLVPLGLAIAFFIALCGAVGAGRLAAAAETIVYKKTGDTELMLFIEKPLGGKAVDRRPAIVFPGAAHGYFNKDVVGIPGFSETLADADRFLISLGWLAARATP
jgi:hypothetical protein